MAGPPVLGFVKKVVDDKKVSRDSFFFFQFRIWWDVFVFFADEFPILFFSIKNRDETQTKLKLLGEILRRNLLINIQHPVVFRVSNHLYWCRVLVDSIKTKI